MKLQTLNEQQILITLIALSLLLLSAYIFGTLIEKIKGPGIVLVTVAYSANIISLEFFTVLILTTMLSSLIAGYFLRYQQKLDKNIFNQLS